MLTVRDGAAYIIAAINAETKRRAWGANGLPAAAAAWRVAPKKKGGEAHPKNTSLRQEPSAFSGPRGPQRSCSPVRNVASVASGSCPASALSWSIVVTWARHAPRLVGRTASWQRAAVPNTYAAADRSRSELQPSRAPDRGRRAGHDRAGRAWMHGGRRALQRLQGLAEKNSSAPGPPGEAPNHTDCHVSSANGTVPECAAALSLVRPAAGGRHLASQAAALRWTGRQARERGGVAPVTVMLGRKRFMGSGSGQPIRALSSAKEASEMTRNGKPSLNTVLNPGA